MIRGAACFRKLFQSSAVSSKVAARCYTAQAAVQPAIYSSDEESADIDWDNLGFQLIQTDYMYMTKCSDDGIFRKGQLNRYGNINLSPSAGVLNYGQGLFEGTKAYRRDDGRVFLFRPEQNAIRMQIGAERMCMPSPTTDQFVDAVKQTALANKRWIPPSGKGSLYIRPLLIGTGPILGLAPAPEYTFLVYACPVGNYFKVEERLIEADELISADEVFCTGTAVGVAPVGSITYKGQRIDYKISSDLSCKQFYSRLVGIQRGVIKDERDWIVEIE
uniref:Branched-chain-amino-acid aminotransferase n=1 Tax=Solanum lycopersicum TaxID=4081 RepID=A0A3Q7G9G9_SOLLC